VKNCHGSVVNPSWWASGDTVSVTPTATTAEGGQCQHETGPAAEERHPPGADREDDQRLGGKRFHEPAGANWTGPACSTSAKCPQQITRYAHTLRSRLAHVRRERAAPSARAQRGKEQIVLADLPGKLADQASGLGGFLGVCRCPMMRRVQALQRDAPFEHDGQQHVSQRLQQITEPPLLVAGDPQHTGSEVVHPDDGGEHVVAVVVGIPLLRGDTGHVPLPGAGMDFRVVPPIPLIVADVMAEFHVLDALGHGERGGSEHPAGLAAAGTDSESCGNSRHR